MRHVLVVGGLDPTGGAGITADTLHLADLGSHALPVASCVTVQTPARFDGIEEVPAATFQASLEAAFATAKVAAAKTGLMASPEQVAILADVLRGTGVPLVVDPVGMPSAASPDQGTARRDVLLAIRDDLAPLATLLTPNLAELSAFAGNGLTDASAAEGAARTLLARGCGAVLVKGVAAGRDVVDLLVDGTGTERIVHPRDGRKVHGTGCALAARIAGHLANDLPLRRAVALAAADLERLRRDARPTTGQHLMSPSATIADDEAPLVRAVERAIPEIIALLPPTWVAECGANLAYAPEGARTEQEVAALIGRIRLVAGRPHAPPAARLGASGHVARVALAAAQATGAEAAALNLRHSSDLLDAAARCGLAIGRFSRADEPADSASSVEWGTRMVFERAPVDLVVDEGGPGKEPMARLIAPHPEALVDQLRRLVSATTVARRPLEAVR